MAVSEKMPPSRYGLAVPELFIVTALLLTAAVVLALYSLWVAAIVCGAVALLCAWAGAGTIQRFERRIRENPRSLETPPENAVETGMAPPTPVGDIEHEPMAVEPEVDRGYFRGQNP